MNRIGVALSTVGLFAAGAVMTSCGDRGSPFKDGERITNSFSAAVGTVWVFSLISLWNETDERVKIASVSLPDDAGFEVLDSRLLPQNEPQPIQPVTVESLKTMPSLSAAVVGPDEVATLFLALRVTTNDSDVSWFDHLTIALDDGRTVRYDDVRLVVCRELEPGTACPPDAPPFDLVPSS